jgi:hypothetical protein
MGEPSRTDGAKEFVPSDILADLKPDLSCLIGDIKVPVTF